MDKILSNPLGVLALGSAISGSLVLVMKLRDLYNVIDTKNGVVVITGCDSGIGYSLAIHCYELGFCVFAGVLNMDSLGAESLKEKDGDSGSIIVFKIDVTKPEDVKQSVHLVTKWLDENSNFYLHSIINNAGIMVVGEFEWLTDELIFQQVNVNLLGSMRFTKQFLPLLRRHKGRVINVSSHCALAGLPGMAVYAASKAGLQSWNDAIRIEYGKYGVKVISVIPGSFVDQSNILLNQSGYAKKMTSAMTDEAREFYGDYFNRFQQYVSGFSKDLSLHKLKDNRFYSIFTDALKSKTPCACYENGPLRYTVYHFLFRVFPISFRDYFVESFVRMPKYKAK